MIKNNSLTGDPQRTTTTDVEQRLKDDFSLFLRLCWKSLDLPPPTRAQLAMARYLQDGGNRIMLQCFRGLGKSWVTAAFVLWTLFCDRDKKIMVVSASKQRADDFSIFCQRCVLEFEWLAHLRPQDDDQRWSRVSFDVAGCRPAQSPSVKSVGIGGQLTGSRADLIVADDIETPNNSATDLMREKLLQLITEFESVLTPKKDSRIIFLGTPQTTFTIYKTLHERSYIPMVWPARYPKTLVGYEDTLAKELLADIEREGLDKLSWTPTDTRFSEINLLEREQSMSRSNFMLQFMLDTSLSDALKFPLKLSDFSVMPLDPAKGPSEVIWGADKETLLDLPAVALPGDRWHRPKREGEFVPWGETIVAVDPSGRGKDETVAVVLSQINGFLFIRDIFASQDGYSDKTLCEILRRAKRYSATTCLIESNFGDGAIMELMRKHATEMKVGMNFEEVRATTRKEDRIIDTLEPVLNQHRLIIDQRLIDWDYRSNPDQAPEERLPRMLMYQLTRMCREKGAVKHDDRVDALALGVKYFQDVLAISAQQQAIDHSRQQWQNMVDGFLNAPTLATDLLVAGSTFDEPITHEEGPIVSWISHR
jgi:hypothetical protein